MITSYAQALEDVLLFRALGDIDGGFYIDVGANDPVLDSVTKFFYERGWRGINIEPSPSWFQKIVADRPRDINLNVVLSDRPGIVTFHEIEGSGLSTMIEGIANRHESNGFPSKAYDVAADTLAAICEKHAPRTIHFLKIDVEGAEEHVLRGADFDKHRPWIILVEATEPLSHTPSHLGWDSLLTQAGYEFVLFDGLNRFYLACEKADLKPFFWRQADAYQTSHTIWTIGHWQRIANEREAELTFAKQELADVKNSRWWKARERVVGLSQRLRRR